MTAREARRWIEQQDEAHDIDYQHLAEVAALTDGQAWAAKRLARKYRGQLPVSLVEQLGVGGSDARR